MNGWLAKASREPQQGPGKHSRGAPLGRIFFEFFLLKWRSLLYFIFVSDGGAPNVAGLGVTYPVIPYPSSRRAWLAAADTLKCILRKAE